MLKFGPILMVIGFLPILIGPFRRDEGFCVSQSGIRREMTEIQRPVAALDRKRAK